MVNNFYKVEDIFPNWGATDEDVLMNIPDEILTEMGWKAGDTLGFTWEDGSISITKVTNGKK
tara:strand:+ start:615 stop:800 length:186 start_codon:yes stop_codon:yes gene_type:complete